MAGINRLLVASDLSGRSDRAVERAVLLAGGLGAKLTVLHVVDDDLPASIADRRRDEARLLLSEQLDGLKNAPMAREVKIVFGSHADTILAVADADDVDLIVLGVHRNESSRPMFLGTTAERVVRAGRWPVLMVKNRPSAPYRDVMVAVDFSIYSRCALDLAVHAAPAARFHLIHAFNFPFRGFLAGHEGAGSKRYERQMTEQIRGEFAAFLAAAPRKPGRHEEIVREGSAREILHEELERIHPDLLALGTHGRAGVAHAFLGSVAEDMLTAPPCDVLVAKAW